MEKIIPMTDFKKVQSGQKGNPKDSDKPIPENIDNLLILLAKWSVEWYRSNNGKIPTDGENVRHG